MSNLTDYIDAKLQSIEALEQQILSIITSDYQVGDGWIKRGPLQTHVYHKLGFQGRSGNAFARYLNRIMAKHGFRVSYYAGQRVYYGVSIPVATDEGSLPQSTPPGPATA